MTKEILIMTWIVLLLIYLYWKTQPKKELPNYPNKNNDIEIVGKYSFCHSDSEDDQELRAGNYIGNG